MTLLTTNQIHVICCQGHFYNASDAIIDYAYLTRYLAHYDDIRVLVRTRHADHVDTSLPQIDGEGVRVISLPDPQSPWRAVLSLPTLIRDITRAVRNSHACYLKMPDALGTLVGLILWCLRRAYAVEVVADSYECIRHAKKTMFGCKLVARLFDRLTCFIVSRATAVTYISQFLQLKYPHPMPDRQFVFCSVDISDTDRGQPRRRDDFDVAPFRLVAAGRLSAEKGHMHLIHAMKSVIETSERSVRLDVLGEGPERLALETEVKALGLEDHVQFLGYVKRGTPLNTCLDRAQLYVLPSLTEGMGRGLIEAMARGVPCVATAVGGVPEYLDQHCLVPPADSAILAEKILEVMNEPDTLASWSTANILATLAFSPENMQATKTRFWSAVKVENVTS
ncbi:MAG: glycosyltransferase family 4 protein [Phycisphaeraceae bacterium]|nr:glycosyltransferase family 4 protein [Phycisphaeraceae bacterium]